MKDSTKYVFEWSSFMKEIFLEIIDLWILAFKGIFHTDHDHNLLIMHTYSLSVCCRTVEGEHSEYFLDECFQTQSMHNAGQKAEMFNIRCRGG